MNLLYLDDGGTELHECIMGETSKSGKKNAEICQYDGLKDVPAGGVASKLEPGWLHPPRKLNERCVLNSKKIAYALMMQAFPFRFQP